MIRRLIDLILDLFPIYLEPLDLSVPPDMQHLLDQLDGKPIDIEAGYERVMARFPKIMKRLSE